MYTLWHDLRHAIRVLAKSPGFSGVAVIVLALGIGANTAIFGLVNAVLFKPLPYRDASRLVAVWEDASQIGFPQNTPAPANFFDWKKQNQVFEDMAAVDTRSFNLTGDGTPVRVMGYAATANFLPLLGTPPLLGRTFGAPEDSPGGPKVAVIQYGLWQRQYGGDPNVIGRNILLDGDKYTVIGVMPRNFSFRDTYTQIWVPIAFTAREAAQRNSHYLTVIARLKPGVTMERARSDMGAIMARIARDYQVHMGIAIVPLRDQFSGRAKLAVLVLLAGVGCVLLIACANLANLLLSRAVVRQREMAVRIALGASRSRLVRQMLTESVTLAGTGGLLGMALAAVGRAFLQKLVPDALASSAAVQLDLKVLLFAAGVSVLTGIAFGMVPALHSSSLNVNESLKQGGGRSGAGGPRSRVRSAFVVAEMAIALVLLVAAGLMLQTFARLRGVDPGFQPDNVVTMRTVLPDRYSDYPKRAAFYESVLRDVRSTSGAVSAAYCTAVPLTSKGNTNWATPEGRDDQDGNDVLSRQVSTGYFETMGIPLRKGRLFDEHDRPDSTPVAVVSETFARGFWPGQDAVGRRFRLNPDRPWITVAGVVGDVREMGLDAPNKPEMYFPYTQGTAFWQAPRALVIRVAGEPAGVIAAARRAVSAADKDQPVSNVMTLDDVLNEEVQDRKLQITLLASFAGLALFLAAIGIYGVLSCLASQRRQEIGIRMALGARPADIVRLVVRQGIWPSLVGIGIGLAAALGLTRLLSSLLFGVRANDPRTFGAVVVLLLAVALVAGAAPAARAMRVDPVVALRDE